MDRSTWLEQGCFVPAPPSDPEGAAIWWLARWWTGAEARRPLSKDATPSLAAQPAYLRAAMRAAFIDLHAPEVLGWARVGAAHGDGALAGLAAGVEALTLGRTADALDHFRTAAHAARNDAEAGLHAECAIFEALAAIEEKDAEAYVASARRAFRIARAEAMPHLELFAAMTLARARRMGGSAHLAGHILQGVRDLAPAPWRRWLAWESAFSGEYDAPSGAPLARVVDAAKASKPAAFHAAADALDSTTLPAPFRRDASTAVQLIDRTRSPSEAVRAWRSGRADVSPRGLGALSPNAAPVYLVVEATGRSERVLSLGLPLNKGIEVVHPGERPQARTASALTRLAMAGEAQEERSFFEDLYGFRYEPELHRAVLDTLLYRARSMVEGVASITRSEGRVALTPIAPFAVWDPAFAKPLESRLTQLLALRGRQNPDQAAAELGYSRRAVLDALKELVKEGACKRTKSGRYVHYELLDTTFTDPTVERFRAMRGLEP
ncbi:MAG: hypothetical protein AAF938_13765 [Myxococcota bacterium]